MTDYKISRIQFNGVQTFAWYDVYEGGNVKNDEGKDVYQRTKKLRSGRVEFMGNIGIEQIQKAISKEVIKNNNDLIAIQIYAEDIR